jgi:hypothetical protein
MSDTDRTPRRDPAGATLGAIFLIGFGGLAYTAWDSGGWGIIAAIPCVILAALGAYGLVSELQRAPRDGKGRRIR